MADDPSQQASPSQQGGPSQQAGHAYPTRLSRGLALLLGVAGAIFVVVHFADLERFLALLEQARPIWLLPAVGFQAVTYASVAFGWKLVLAQAEKPLPLKNLLPIALSKLFADQAVPAAGMGGNLLLIDRLTRLGVTRGTAAASLIVSLIGYYVAYAFLALVMIFVLWLQEDATPLLVGLVTTFLLVALAIPSLALWLRKRGSEPLPPRIERFKPLAKLLEVIGDAPAALVRDHRLLAKVSFCNALVFLADAMTLAAIMLAFGLPFLPGAAFLALMAGSISGTLSPIPMGLGTFEAAATAILASLNIPFEEALASVLVLRGFTLWLPLFPAFYLLRKGGHAIGTVKPNSHGGTG